MQTETEIVLQHGWGFDATSWSKWMPALEKRGRVICGERSYFGAKEVTPTFSESAGRKIVVAHSFGVHLLPKDVLRQANAILLIASFVSLQSNARAIRAMQRKFPTAPDVVITDFWRNCYAPEIEGISLLPPPGMNETALEDDLASLASSTLDVETLAAIPQVMLLEPEADRIVPEEARLQLAEVISPTSVVRIAGGCHTVHMTQAERCLQFVLSLVTEKQKEACQTQEL